MPVTIRPAPERPRLKRVCEAPVVNHREVTSSNGQTELRPVIATDMVIGSVRKLIHITLTNRESMSYRMLLGRTAIGEDAVIVHNRSFVLADDQVGILCSISQRHRATHPHALLL